MGLTKQHLTDTFARAREFNSPFVFVTIVSEGIEQIITIPKKSFDGMESFYNRAYNDALVHVMNSKVYVRGLSFGESGTLDIIA